MSKKQKIKSPLPTNRGQKVGVSVGDTIEIKNFDYPIFCFRHLQANYNVDSCSDEDKIAFAQRLSKLSSMSWNDLKLAPRHGFGSEKIDKTSIKAPWPPFLTEDVNFLLAFRFSGMKPILGHRHHFVFHLIFIDHNYSVYDHS